MRTLSKPPKVKSSSQVKVPNEKKETGKVQSKKVIKTVFNSPFRYKIQTLSLQDSEQVTDILVNYAKITRKELGLGEIKKQNEKFISFNSKVVHQKPPLVTPSLIFGIKHCLRAVQKQEQRIKMLVFFYDENIHDKFQELMCQTIYKKVAYIVLRETSRLKLQLGVKKLLCIGIDHEQLSNQLLKYGSRCLIQIPWLFDSSWIPLAKKQE